MAPDSRWSSSDTIGLREVLAGVLCVALLAWVPEVQAQGRRGRSGVQGAPGAQGTGAQGGQGNGNQGGQGNGNQGGQGTGNQGGQGTGNQGGQGTGNQGGQGTGNQGGQGTGNQGGQGTGNQGGQGTGNQGGQGTGNQGGQGNGNQGAPGNGTSGGQGTGNQGGQGNGDDLRQGGGPSGDGTRGQGGSETHGGPLTSPGGGTFPGGGSTGGQQSGSRSGDQIGPSAGEGIESPVGNAAITRWEAVKQTLRDMMRAYVMQDITAFMKLFSRNFTQDSGIYRNAVLDDFQNEVNPNIDIELLEYRVNFGTILVRLRWSRNSVSAQTGNQINTATGEATVLFDRFDGFKLQSWQGPTPFGVRDPQLQGQTNAGQLGTAPTPTPEPTGPVLRTLTLTVSPAQDVALVDLEGGTVRKFNVEDDFSATAAEELRLQASFGRGFQLQVRHNGNENRQLGGCVAGGLETFRNILEENLLGIFPWPTQGAGTRVYAVKTREGSWAFVEVQANAGVGSADLTLRYYISSSLAVNSSGSTDCPEPGGGGPGGGGIIVGGGGPGEMGGM